MKVISGERQESYGPPERNFENIAKIWSVIFGIEVTPSQVGWAMCAVKMAREAHSHKRDNVVDLIGYAALIGEIEHNNNVH